MIIICYTCLTVSKAPLVSKSGFGFFAPLLEKVDVALTSLQPFYYVVKGGCGFGSTFSKGGY